ncbi:MAG: hypothetical protein E6K18_02385 [Methanobacteriota archaeon]|nr:MAG: hypothetical protein E6K18_02385 [Euryarchaeota archaeon]
MEEPKAPEAPQPAPAKGKGMWIGIVVVAIVIVILLAAVFGGLLGPPAEKSLRIGTVLTLTGNSGLEAFGPKNQKGALLAVSEINAAGGVLGNPIVMVNEDDGGVDSQAHDRAQKLVTTDHVDAILGATGSGKCQAVLSVAQPNQVVEISASCTSPVFSNLSYTGGWFFRTAPSDALQGVVAANYSYVNRTFRTMAVIGNDNAYGRGLANVFATEFRRHGGTATVTILPEKKTSYASDLQTILAPPMPDAVYMAEYPTDGLQIMKDWAANPPWSGVKWVFSEGLLDQTAFVDKLVQAGINPATFEGSAPGAYLGVVGALYSDFKTRYQAAHANEDPGLFTGNAYDAVYLLAAAAQKAGLATPTGIKDNILAVSTPPGTAVHGGQWATILTEIAAGHDLNYEGASGALNLDKYGDPLSGYGIWGTNATNKITTLQYFNEQTVVSMLPPSPAPPMPGTRSSAVMPTEQWRAWTRP